MALLLCLRPPLQALGVAELPHLKAFLVYLSPNRFDKCVCTAVTELHE